ISFVLPDASELLIEEARRKGRRRRLTRGIAIFSVVVIIAVIAFIALRGPSRPGPLANRESGKSNGVNYTPTNVTNLAGSDTFTVRGSRVWVALDRESPTKNYFAVTELNANKGSLVRVI